MEMSESNSHSDAIVVKRAPRRAGRDHRQGTRKLGAGVHGDDLTQCSAAHVLCAPHTRRRRFPRLAPHRRPLAYREEEGGPPLGRPYPFGFLFGLTARGESTPHEPQDVPRAESGGLCACGALSPRVGGANRCAIHSTVFRGEGKPLPTPHPRGAARRRRAASEFHHRLLSLRETRGGLRVHDEPGLVSTVSTCRSNSGMRSAGGGLRRRRLPGSLSGAGEGTRALLV